MFHVIMLTNLCIKFGITKTFSLNNNKIVNTENYRDKSYRNRIDLLDMIGSFLSGTTASLVAKNGTEKLSQPFEELQGLNSEFKLITPKPITGIYFETNQSMFGLAGLPMTAILTFELFISELFEKLQD